MSTKLLALLRSNALKRSVALLALVALFAFGDVAGPSDQSVFGSYHLDMSVTP